MVRNPRVGLILIRMEAFARPETRFILADIHADAGAITRRLCQDFDFAGPWIVDRPEALPACQRALRETELDMVILAYQTQASEEYLAGLLEAVGSTPLVVWCYLPWRRFPQPASAGELLRGSGPVGTFGALGVLRNLGASFFFTFGSIDDPRLIHDLRQAGRAASLRRSLAHARIGLLPGPENGVLSSFVSEARLMADFGPLIQNIPVGEFLRAVEGLPHDQVEAYLGLVRKKFGIAGVMQETLEKGARAALGLVRLAEERSLDVLGVSETSAELRAAPVPPPSLFPDLLAPVSALFQPVAEPGAAVANLILHRLTGSPTLLLELWFWDEPRNLVVGGHLGIQNPAVAGGKVWICSDANFFSPLGRQGVQYDFMARPGRVTLFQLRGTPHGWQAIAASGVCLEGQPWVEACSHAVVRLDAPVDHFLHRVAAAGAARHWILAYGSVIPEIEAFCQMAGVPLEVLQT